MARHAFTSRMTRLMACALLLGLAGPALAADRLMTGLGEAQALYRSTTVALRAGRADEAQASLKRLIDAWSEAAASLRADPPPAAARITMLAEIMDGGTVRLRRASEALGQRRGEAALGELEPLKREWILLRRSAGLYGLVECLDEASDAHEALQALRRTPPDLAKPETRTDIITKSAIYRYALRRCEPYAAQDLGADPDYRRQVDSIGAALDVIDAALRLRDPALFERVLTDLKGFDTQLSQRYGG